MALIYIVKCVVKTDAGINASENMAAFTSEEDAEEQRKILQDECGGFDVEYRVESLPVL